MKATNTNAQLHHPAVLADKARRSVACDDPRRQRTRDVLVRPSSPGLTLRLMFGAAF